jgi:HTH-type transcriptional regulator/antitoxin HipB
MTQAELADRLGWDQKVVSNIERGAKRVTVLELLDLAGVLGLDPCKVLRQIGKR